jgi:hypothetical protein
MFTSVVSNGFYWSNTTYFAADAIHMNSGGQALLAKYFQKMFRPTVGYDYLPNVIPFTPPVTGDFVANTVYANTNAKPIIIHAQARLTPASVAGAAQFDVMASPTGHGTSYTKIGGAKLVTIIGSLVTPIDSDFTAFIGSGNYWYVTNSSTGAGNSAAIVTGSCQIQR